MKKSAQDSDKPRRKMSKIFVCFIGSDGSGKSTIVGRVFESFHKKRKIKSKQVYGGNSPAITKLAMILGRRLFLKDGNMYSDYDKYLINKKELYKRSPKFVRAYILLSILEYYWQVLFNLIIPYKLGYSIISDRYVYDAIINILAIDKALSIADIKKLLDKAWYFIPRPDITFLIQVPEAIAIERKDDIPSIGYLKIRNKFYEELGKIEPIIVLDGTLSIAELEKRASYEIDKLLS